jgi:pSer/pThr/pTyr-binding forkhead associated (FHA) protein
MKANSIKIVKTLSPPSEAGTHYRLVCMTGKNKGLSYYINKDRVILGRSDNADVQVLDTKSSREHVELVKISDGYVLTDLGSQNGVVVNDLKVTQHNLVDGDRIIIGATVFKFNKIVVERKFEIVEAEDEEDDDEDDEVAQIDFNDEKSQRPCCR